MSKMKFPPAYPTYSDELNLFDRAVILTFQVIVCCAVPYSAGVVVWGLVMGAINSI